MENFQALPGVLDDCIIRVPETVQDKFFFSVLMESGLMLSGRAAREYSGAHFKFQESLPVNRTKSRQHTKCLQVYPIG